MRDDFSEEVKRVVAARVGNRCSNCGALTSGPQIDESKSLNVGVAAHITAASPGGPRYDSKLSPKERAHIDNAIWLCQNCAKLVDNDPARYSEAELRTWKREAENRALAEIGRTRGHDHITHTTVAEANVGTSLDADQTRKQGVYLVPELPPQGVFGREKDLSQLSRLLVLEEDIINVPPLALLGMGGIGKTTLSIAFGHRADILRKFSDGVLWVELGPNPTIRLLLNLWGEVLGLDLRPEPDVSACKTRLRELFAHRKALLIVDDVWETVHGSQFLVAGPYCRTLFTTRESSIAYDLVTRERAVRVDVLGPKAALTLLRKMAGGSPKGGRKLEQQLCERLGYLPLALKLAGRMLANEADVPSRMERLLGELIERGDARLHLLQTEGRLGLEEDRPASLEAILGMSVNRLSKLDQERFAMLAVFGGEPLWWDIHSARAVWDCTQNEAEDSLLAFPKCDFSEHSCTSPAYTL